MSALLTTNCRKLCVCIFQSNMSSELGVIDGPDSETLLKSLECKICQNRFTDPKVCDCGHVFCLECLKTYLSVNEWNCPVCHMAIRLPHGGLEALPVHSFYQDVIGEIQMLESDNKLLRMSCKFCSDDDKHSASVQCMTCQVSMCDDCASHHLHNGVSNVVPLHRKQDSLLYDILPKRDTPCRFHQTESLLLHCANCQEAVCHKCKDEKHEDHSIEDLSDAAVPSKQKIEEVFGKLREYLNETKEALNDLEKIKNSYMETVETTRQQIENQIQKLIDYILKGKEKLLNDLSQHANDVAKRVEFEERDLKGKDSRAENISDLADNLLNFGNDAENFTYRCVIENQWENIKEEKLNKFGQGYRMNVAFHMRDGLLDMLSKEVGSINVTQNLSPWTARKNVPLTMAPLEDTNVSTLQMRMKQVITPKDFSVKRSQIFSKFVDPKWNLETYKISKSTGQIVTAWMKMDEESEIAARASKRLSMRSASSPTLLAEICSFNQRGDLEYQKTVERLPDGTMIRLAIGGPSTILMAVYPGTYAASLIGHSKRKNSSKKDKEHEGIYVAVFESGNFVCGELRKIAIPDIHVPAFDFDITSRGIIAFKPALSNEVRQFSASCEEIVSDFSQENLKVLKVLEAQDGGIIVVLRDVEDTIICEEIGANGDRTRQFDFHINSVASSKCEFKDVCFDRNGNMLFHLNLLSEDLLYMFSGKDYRKEYLSKPDMMHKIDSLSVLPDGRLCIFDKAECVLMTLRYL